MGQIFKSISEQQTADIAAQIAKSAKGGDVYLLDAPMGAGKTAFARGFIRALCGVGIDVPSPTYTLVQTYELGNKTLFHYDLYRLKSHQEIFDIGWEDSVGQPNSICLIEWPGRAGGFLPRRAKHIDIRIMAGENMRQIEVRDAD